MDRADDFDVIFKQASLPAKIAHIPIRAYQLTLSSIVGRTCRFMPSCSYYTDEAILRHGFVKGVKLGFNRICRCTPLNEGGIDNVPQ